MPKKSVFQPLNSVQTGLLRKQNDKKSNKDLFCNGKKAICLNFK